MFQHPVALTLAPVRHDIYIYFHTPLARRLSLRKKKKEKRVSGRRVNAEIFCVPLAFFPSLFSFFFFSGTLHDKYRPFAYIWICLFIPASFLFFPVIYAMKYAMEFADIGREKRKKIIKEKKKNLIFAFL